MAYLGGLYSARRVGYQINDAPIVNGGLGILGPDPSTALVGFTTAAGRSGAATAMSGVGTSTGSAAAGTGSSASVTFSSMSLSSSPSSAASPDSSMTDSKTQTGLSTGAKVGIGVGVGLAAIIFLSVLIALFLKRRKGSGRRRLSTQELPGHSATGKGMWHEMRGHEAPELNNDERSAELEGAEVKMR